MVLKSSMAWLNSRRRTCRWGLLLLSCPPPPLPLPLPLLLEPPLLLLRLKRLVILGAGPPQVMPTYWQDGYVSITFYQCHPSRFHFFARSVSHSNTTLAVNCYECWTTKAPLVNATRYLNSFCMAVCSEGHADATKKIKRPTSCPQWLFVWGSTKERASLHYSHQHLQRKTERQCVSEIQKYKTCIRLLFDYVPPSQLEHWFNNFRWKINEQVRCISIRYI